MSGEILVSCYLKEFPPFSLLSNKHGMVSKNRQVGQAHKGTDTKYLDNQSVATTVKPEKAGSLLPAQFIILYFYLSLHKEI